MIILCINKDVQGYSVDGFDLFRYWLQCHFLGFTTNVMEDSISLFGGDVYQSVAVEYRRSGSTNV